MAIQDRRLSSAVRDTGRQACHTGTDDRAQKRGLQKIEAEMPLKCSNFAYEPFQGRQAGILLKEFLMFPKGDF